jgi:hypothetical protein
MLKNQLFSEKGFAPIIIVITVLIISASMGGVFIFRDKIIGSPQDVAPPLSVPEKPRIVPEFPSTEVAPETNVETPPAPVAPKTPPSQISPINTPASPAATQQPSPISQLPQQSTIPWGKKYLMAFHACDTASTNCNDPRNHKTHIAGSNDGASWSPISGYTPHLGSVPDLILRGNTLYVFNPGWVRRYRIDKDKWEDKVQVRVNHANGTQEYFVDPSPYMDENGKIVLFYLVGGAPGTGDPAGCFPQGTTCAKYFRSATEVEGSDGTSFIVDSGNRAEVVSNTGAADPDIFKDKNGYVLYISRANSVQVFTSTELRGIYTKVPSLPDGMLESNLGGIPSGHYDEATGQYWTYVHIPGQPRVIRRAVHKTISTPLLSSDFSTIISGSNFPGLGNTFNVESPGFTLNTP